MGSKISLFSGFKAEWCQRFIILYRINYKSKKVNSALLRIDLSNFNTPELTSLTHTFEGCSLLESVIFGNGIDTSQVTDMSYLFTDCYSLMGVLGWNI